jgi:hypothetical protein
LGQPLSQSLSLPFGHALRLDLGHGFIGFDRNSRSRFWLSLRNNPKTMPGAELTRRGVRPTIAQPLDTPASSPLARCRSLARTRT